MKIQHRASIPGKVLQTAPPTPLLYPSSRASDTGHRGEICTKFNMIPNFFPTTQIVNGKEVFVSGSTKDSNYRIYTIEA